MIWFLLNMNTGEFFLMHNDLIIICISTIPVRITLLAAKHPNTPILNILRVPHNELAQFWKSEDNIHTLLLFLF